VHFPIALLLVAPILLIPGMVPKDWARGCSLAGLLLVVLGAVGAWVAAGSGLAAMGLAVTDGDGQEVLEHHQKLALLTRIVFTVLVLVLLAIRYGPRLFRKELSPKVELAVNICYLVPYAFGMLLIVNVAYLGGRLVHEFGVRAML
jgi:uncharacterized membrane protein